MVGGKCGMYRLGPGFVVNWYIQGMESSTHLFEIVQHQIKVWGGLISSKHAGKDEVTLGKINVYYTWFVSQALAPSTHIFALRVHRHHQGIIVSYNCPYFEIKRLFNSMRKNLTAVRQSSMADPFISQTHVGNVSPSFLHRPAIVVKPLRSECFARFRESLPFQNQRIFS